MKIEDIKAGDVLCSTDRHGTGYYKVIKVNRVTVDLQSENGNKVRAYPHIFERKVTYPVAAFEASAGASSSVVTGRAAPSTRAESISRG